VTAPVAPEIAPPGDYMLFLVNSTGVPSVASFVRLGFGTVPAAPTSLTATAVASNRINLAWTDNASNEQGFHIERSVDGATYFEFAVAGPNATSFADTAVNASTQYWYRLRAFNAAGASTLVGPATATTPATGGSPSPPVAAYAFNEGSGSSATDASGHGNTGTITSPSWTTGKNGGALAFNGTSTVVSVPDSNNSLDVSTLTIEAWVYKTAASIEYHSLLGRQSGTSWLDSWILFYDNVNFGDAYRFCALDCVVGPSSTGDMNTWVHLAATEDGTFTRLYRNGVLVATSSQHAGILAPENTKVCIGSGANDATLNCNQELVSARIDDVRIYGRALTAAQILQDMNIAVGGVPDTTPPTISIQQPADGATVTGNVTVTANAADNVAVAGVQFRLDGANLGAEDTTAPYSISWDSATTFNSSHTLTAIARDGSGNTATSSAVTVTTSNVDNVPPIISNIAASEIQTTAATIGWTTNEPADSQVEYGLTISYGSSTNLITSKITSHAVPVNGLTPGTLYNFRVKSRDAAGNLTTSANRTFTTTAVADTTFPTVTLTAPADGATVSGVVQVTANATDNVAVAGVQFKQGSTNIGAEDTSAPYGASWNTAGLPAGAYTLTAVARDQAGNTTTSTAVTVQVASGGSPPGPVVAYAFNENSGATAADASGNNVTASITGPSWTAGKYGSALAFNGTARAVTIPDINNLLDGTTLTVEAWVYKTAPGPEYHGIMGRQTGTSWFDSWILFYDGAQFNDAYRFCALDCVTGPSSTGDMNTWVHVAATEDGTTTKLYRNGVLVAASPAHSGVIAPETTGVCVGAGANDATLACNSEFVSARIDEVRIYGRALTAEEIQSDMNTPVGSVLDTTAPTVSLQQPASGATVSGSVTVTATASDNVGVVGVQFKVDGANIGAEDTTSPYSASWNTTTVGNGSHSLTAVARDAAGNATTSSAVTVTVSNSDTTGPTVSITAPANGATVQSSVTVSANASDNVGVVGVQFKVDGANIGAEDTTSPYSVSWNTTTIGNGQHSLTAVARDAAGNSTTSSTVSVTVNNPDSVPPTVSITAPANNATVSGTVSVTATAADNVGVVGVQFKQGATNIGSEDTTAPYSVPWNTTGLTSGSYTLTAVARDAGGNTTTSSAVTVTVSNSDTTGPTVSITAPANGATVQSSVTVSANASDNVGVVGAQFKVDGANIGAEDTTSPYSVSWNTTTIGNGQHSLTAVARDAAGNSTTSSTVSVTVNNPDTTLPNVSLTEPASGAVVAGTVTVSASASDNVGVVGVQFKRGTTNIGAEDITAPYSVSWDTLPLNNATYSLTAVARDAAGNTSTSTAVSVTVSNDKTAPTVSLTAPANNATVAGTVTISANASDAVGVVGVRFSVDGVDVGAEDTTAPYSISWNTATVSNGAHVLTAVARDAAGNTRTSNNRKVNVSNPAPAPPPNEEPEPRPQE
jgi:hypothetical protein